jgi:hypothetical protein
MRIVKMKIVILGLCFSVAGAFGEELLKSTDFTKGKGGWQGPGGVVHVSPDGQEQPAPGPDAIPVLRVNLSKNRWSVLEHRFKLGKKEDAVSLKVVLKTSPDYQPLSESREYASEDFREGGQYGWSARIFTKAGLLIQLSEGSGWQYRPKSLKASSNWQTVTASFDGLKSRQNETLALCFPPGDGHVDIRSVSLESR